MNGVVLQPWPKVQRFSFTQKYVVEKSRGKVNKSWILYYTRVFMKILFMYNKNSLVVFSTLITTRKT